MIDKNVNLRKCFAAANSLTWIFIVLNAQSLQKQYKIKVWNTWKN